MIIWLIFLINIICFIVLVLRSHSECQHNSKLNTKRVKNNSAEDNELIVLWLIPLTEATVRSSCSSEYAVSAAMIRNMSNCGYSASKSEPTLRVTWLFALTPNYQIVGQSLFARSI